MVNEIAKLYSEGNSLKSSIIRGVGQQSQRREKDELRKFVIPENRKAFDDTDIVSFIKLMLIVDMPQAKIILEEVLK